MPVPQSPGASWMEVITRSSLAGFSEAFTRDVALELSVSDLRLVGPRALQSFFRTTRGMYDRIEFVHESLTDGRVILEWEGVFQDLPVGGVTILCLYAKSTIQRVILLHRPYAQVVAFAAELARRFQATS